jgi:hypothetical protein
MNSIALIPEAAEDAAIATPDHFKEHRIRHTEKLLLRGVGYSRMLAEVCGAFGVCERTAQSYAAEAARRIKETNAKDREIDIAVAKARFEHIMYLAMESNQLAVAVAANREIVKLLGLAERDRVEHGASDSLTELMRQIRQGNITPQD